MSLILIIFYISCISSDFAERQNWQIYEILQTNSFFHLKRIIILKAIWVFFGQCLVAVHSVDLGFILTELRKHWKVLSRYFFTSLALDLDCEILVKRLTTCTGAGEVIECTQYLQENPSLPFKTGVYKLELSCKLKLAPKLVQKQPSYRGKSEQPFLGASHLLLTLIIS